MGAPTAVHGTREQHGRRVPCRRCPLAPWVILGGCGAWGMVLTGTRIAAVPDPHLARWWFSLPAGGSPFESIGFYVSLALVLAAWVGLGRLSLRRTTHPGPGLGGARRVGPALPARSAPVQPGPLQLRGPGPAGPSRRQPLHRGPLHPWPRPPAVRGGQRVAGHHLALRPALRGVEQGGVGARRGVARRAGDGLPGPGAGRRGAGHGVPPPAGPPPRHRSGDGPVARGPQPPGPVQLRGLGPQRRPDGRPAGGRGHRSASPAGWCPAWSSAPWPPR